MRAKKTCAAHKKTTIKNAKEDRHENRGVPAMAGTQLARPLFGLSLVILFNHYGTTQLLFGYWNLAEKGGVLLYIRQHPENPKERD